MTTSRVPALIDYLVAEFTTAATLGAATPPVLVFDGQAVTARSVTVASGQTWQIPLPPSVYGVGPITVTWSGTLTASSVAITTVAGS